MWQGRRGGTMRQSLREVDSAEHSKPDRKMVLKSENVGPMLTAESESQVRSLLNTYIGGLR